MIEFSVILLNIVGEESITTSTNNEFEIRSIRTGVTYNLQYSVDGENFNTLNIETNNMVDVNANLKPFVQQKNIVIGITGTFDRKMDKLGLNSSLQFTPNSAEANSEQPIPDNKYVIMTQYLCKQHFDPASNPNHKKIVGPIIMPMNTKQTLDAELLRFINQQKQSDQRIIYYGIYCNYVDLEQHQLNIVNLLFEQSYSVIVRVESCVYERSSMKEFIDSLGSSKVHKVIGLVSHQLLFQKCDLIITHGGAGSCTAIMMSGVPCILYDHWEPARDQKLNKEIMKHHAIAQLQPEDSEDILVLATHIFEDEIYSENSKRIEKKIKEEIENTKSNIFGIIDSEFSKSSRNSKNILLLIDEQTRGDVQPAMTLASLLAQQYQHSPTMIHILCGFLSLTRENRYCDAIYRETFNTLGFNVHYEAINLYDQGPGHPKEGFENYVKHFITSHQIGLAIAATSDYFKFTSTFGLSTDSILQFTPNAETARDLIYKSTQMLPYQYSITSKYLTPNYSPETNPNHARILGPIIRSSNGLTLEDNLAQFIRHFRQKDFKIIYYGFFCNMIEQDLQLHIDSVNQLITEGADQYAVIIRMEQGSHESYVETLKAMSEGKQNLHLFIGSTSHSLLLPQCYLSIVHAGAGTCTAMLESAIPTIYYEAGAPDQITNRKLMQEYGVALLYPENGKSMYQLVKQISSTYDTFKLKCEEMQRNVKLERESAFPKILKIVQSKL